MLTILLYFTVQSQLLWLTLPIKYWENTSTLAGVVAYYLVIKHFKSTETCLHLSSLVYFHRFVAMSLSHGLYFCSRIHWMLWSCFAHLRIFFFAYFNLDLLFINIERTSWSQNPDNGSPKEQSAIMNKRVTSLSTGGRCLPVYCVVYYLVYCLAKNGCALPWSLDFFLCYINVREFVETECNHELSPVLCVRNMDSTHHIHLLVFHVRDF